MNRVVRAFLVWVMVIATPVQGMAASAMLFCGPSHERMMQGLMADGSGMASSQSAVTWHEDSAADHGVHEHAATEHPGAGNSGAGTDADGTTGLFPHHGKFSCSACAACCSALALPASFVLLAPSGPEHLAPMSPVEPVASHQPDGLDRPPRFVLA
jgi:hypothetical protein